MELKLRLQRVLQIVEEAERTGALSDLERDIVLTELREAYSEVKFAEAKCEVKEECVTSAQPQIGPEVEEQPEPEVEEQTEPEVEFEIIFNEEEDEVEEAPKEENEEVTEEPAVAEQPIATTPKSTKRSPLLSLYEESATTPVLGEQFRDKTSVADTIVCPKGVAESAPVASLRSGIGVADRFMLINELFGGDADAFDVALNALEAQPSFDDCVIYISENYSWRANAEGTKFMMELLQRKYNA